MATLTDEECQLFDVYLRRFDITTADLTAQHVTGGSDALATAEDGALQGTPIVVNSLAEYKKRVGVDDSLFRSGQLRDSFLDYPPPPPSEAVELAGSATASVCNVMATLDNESSQNLQSAFKAYVLGNSEKVKAWEPVINAASFPMNQEELRYDQIVVKANSPLIIGNKLPVTLFANKITVEPGAHIICKTEVTFHVGVFISL